MAKSLIEGEMLNGKKHGYWVTYYANGFKRSEGRYIEGKKEGLWIQYHKNGSKASEASFRDGKNEGEYMCYYENGNRKWGGPIENMMVVPPMAEKKASGSAMKRTVRRSGVSSLTRKAVLARNPMNIHSGSVMFAAKANAQRGATPVHSAEQRFLTNPQKF